LLRHLVNKARVGPLCPLGTQQESHSIYVVVFDSHFACFAEGSNETTAMLRALRNVLKEDVGQHHHNIK